MEFDATFWAAVAFVILMIGFGYLGVHKKVTEALDHRATRIKGELDDAAEERFVGAGDDAEGFEVARAGGLHVEAALGDAGEGGVDRELAFLLGRVDDLVPVVALRRGRAPH